MEIVWVIKIYQAFITYTSAYFLTLYVYCDFWFCFLMAYLCVKICVSLSVFLMTFLGSFSIICLIYSILAHLYFIIVVVIVIFCDCLYSNERDKESTLILMGNKRVHLEKLVEDKP